MIHAAMMHIEKSAKAMKTVFTLWHLTHSLNFTYPLLTAFHDIAIAGSKFKNKYRTNNIIPAINELNSNRANPYAVWVVIIIFRPKVCVF